MTKDVREALEALDEMLKEFSDEYEDKFYWWYSDKVDKWVEEHRPALTPATVVTPLKEGPIDGLDEAIRLLENFVSDRSKFGGETIDEAIRNVCQAARLCAAGGWMPISEAPRDGTEILAWREDAGVLLVRWTCPAEFLTEQEIEKHNKQYNHEPYEWEQDEAWFCADFIQGDRLDADLIPTHWMPLPPPPKEQP